MVCSNQANWSNSPVQALFTRLSTASSLPSSSAHTGSSDPNIGAIAGGVVGGVAGAVLLACAVFFLLRRGRLAWRRKRPKDIEPRAELAEKRWRLEMEATREQHCVELSRDDNSLELHNQDTQELDAMGRGSEAATVRTVVVELDI